MAKLNVMNTGFSMEVNPAVSVLNTLLQNGVSIPHECGGKSQCGTCHILIREGHNHINGINARERIRLAAMGNPEHVRLACQTYAYGDITIEIP